MDELKVGNRFDVMGNWYDEVVEILDVKETKALIIYKTEYGARFYAHMQFKDGKWNPFITGIYCDEGLLYGEDVSKFAKK